MQDKINIFFKDNYKKIIFIIVSIFSIPIVMKIVNYIFLFGNTIGSLLRRIGC